MFLNPISYFVLNLEGGCLQSAIFMIVQQQHELIFFPLATGHVESQLVTELTLQNCGEKGGAEGEGYTWQKKKKKKRESYTWQKKKKKKGNVIPGKARVFSEKLRSVLKAQNGMKAELQV